MRPHVPDAITLVRGGTFRHRFTLPERVETYSAMSAQVLEVESGAVLADLDVRPLDETRRVEVSAPGAVTALWPAAAGRVSGVFSLRLMVGAEVAHSETKCLQILPEVTSNG